MPVRYSDDEIKSMIEARKPLPDNYRSLVRLRQKRGHKEGELGVTGDDDGQYRLILRQSDFNRFDFSVILAVLPEGSNQLFRLRRYNGKSHEHTNPVERSTFYGFHVHEATERYQEYGTREDAFAEETERYDNFHSALDCLLEDCGFEAPADTQGKLFS